ncbi:MAG: ATPase domain-containing protein [Terracidiphilus sp.]
MSAALLRLQIERSLEHRFPAALSPAPRVLETTPTGIRAVDDLLDGGLPAGAITEIAGTQSSGRTSLTLAFVARQTGEGRACAWVDAGDAFDPESAAASGVRLRQLLWVRCGGDEGGAKKGRMRSEFPCGVPAEAKGRPSMDRLYGPIEQSAEKERMAGESGDRLLSGAKALVDSAPVMYGLKPVPFRERSFFAASEAVPLLQDLRVSEFSAACEARVDLALALVTYGPKPASFSGAKAGGDFAAIQRGLKPPPTSEESVSGACAAPGRKKPWPRLEQAIRATDLLLQAGGFAAIVLDLAGTAPEHANRIPLATWFRFRQAAARTRCSLLVLSQAACAQSSAAAVLECAPPAARDKGGSRVLDGFTFSLRRSRGDVTFRSAGSGRKPPESAWLADSAWNVEKRA